MKTPFKFLDAFTYSDRDAYFGRDKEIRALYQMVHETSLVLIYGQSGTGKTSLVQCGLANEFDSADWFPLTIRHQGDINKSFRETLRQRLPAGMPEAETPAKNIAQLYRQYLRPVYLIFDQLEELFILGSRDEQMEFAQSLKDLLDADLRCTVLLVMREEFIGYLIDFEEILPRINDYRMRVEPMEDIRVEQEVIGKSCRKFGIELEDEEQTPKLIVDKVRGDEIILLDDDEQTRKRGLENRIQLPYLQVYLDGLYQKIAAEKAWNLLNQSATFAEKWPDSETGKKEFREWLTGFISQHDTSIQLAQARELPTPEQKQFALERLHGEGFLTKKPEKNGHSWHLNERPYPKLEFHDQQINEFGDIAEVLANFLNQQVRQIKVKLISDYRKQHQLAAAGEVDDGKTSTGDKKRKWGKAGAPQLSEAEREAVKFSNKLDIALRELLGDFVTLEGTKRPRDKESIQSTILTPEQIELALDHLENARILRESGKGQYEIAHDALAKYIATRRTKAQQLALEVAKLVKGKHDTYIIMINNRPDQVGASEYLLTINELKMVSEVEEQLKIGEQLTPAEEVFVQESRSLRDRQQRRKLMLFGGIAGLLLLAMGLFATYMVVDAIEQKVQAEKATAIANKELSNAAQSMDKFKIQVDQIKQKTDSSVTRLKYQIGRLKQDNNDLEGQLEFDSLMKLGDYHAKLGPPNIHLALNYYNQALQIGNQNQLPNTSDALAKYIKNGQLLELDKNYLNLAEQDLLPMQDEESARRELKKIADMRKLIDLENEKLSNR